MNIIPRINKTNIIQKRQFHSSRTLKNNNEYFNRWYNVMDIVNGNGKNIMLDEVRKFQKERVDDLKYLRNYNNDSLLSLKKKISYLQEKISDHTQTYDTICDQNERLDYLIKKYEPQITNLDELANGKNDLDFFDINMIEQLKVD